MSSNAASVWIVIVICLLVGHSCEQMEETKRVIEKAKIECQKNSK